MWKVDVAELILEIANCSCLKPSITDSLLRSWLATHLSVDILVPTLAIGICSAFALLSKWSHQE